MLTCSCSWGTGISRVPVLSVQWVSEEGNVGSAAMMMRRTRVRVVWWDQWRVVEMSLWKESTLACKGARVVLERYRCGMK